MKFTPKVKAPVYPQIHSKLDALIKSNARQEASNARQEASNARQEAEQKKHTQLLTNIQNNLTAVVIDDYYNAYAYFKCTPSIPEYIATITITELNTNSIRKVNSDVLCSVYSDRTNKLWLYNYTIPLTDITYDTGHNSLVNLGSGASDSLMPLTVGNVITFSGTYNYQGYPKFIYYYAHELNYFI